MLRQRAAATGAGAMMQAAFVILAHQGCGAVAAAAAGLDPTFHAGDSNGSSSVLQLSLLRQVLASSADFGWDTSTTHAEWKAEETALILIDLWNCHWCAAMSQRTTDLAFRVNRTASKLRARGVHIVHSPSSPGLEFYQGYASRARVMAAPFVQPPGPVNVTDPAPLPLDTSGPCGRAVPPARPGHHDQGPSRSRATSIASPH